MPNTTAELEKLLGGMLDEIEVTAKDRIDQFWSRHFEINANRSPNDKGRLHCWVRRKNTTLEIWWTTFRFQKTKSGKTQTLKTYIPKGKKLNYSPAILAKHAKCPDELESAQACEAEFARLRHQAAEINKMFRALGRLEKHMTSEDAGNE